MKSNYRNYENRKQVILNHLAYTPFATAHELANLTGASLSTVRRDFISMDREGLIIRSHGGVQAAAPVHPPQQIFPVTAADDQCDAEKEKIAAYAASIIKENSCIYPGGGKTCTLLARYIKDIGYLTIVTTSISAVLELVNSPNVSLTLLGGDIHTGPNFVETTSNERDLEHCIGSLFFDQVFVTTDGVDLRCGYTIRNRRQLPLYQKMLHSSKAFYMLLNSSKFDRRSFSPAFTMEQIDHIVTTNHIPHAYLDYYKEHGKHLILT